MFFGRGGMQQDRDIQTEMPSNHRVWWDVMGHGTSGLRCEIDQDIVGGTSRQLESYPALVPPR